MIKRLAELQNYSEGTRSQNDLAGHIHNHMAYRSRPSDDGGTYYLLPRDEHLLPPLDEAEVETTWCQIEKERFAYKAEQEVDRAVKRIIDRFNYLFLIFYQGDS